MTLEPGCSGPPGNPARQRRSRTAHRAPQDRARSDAQPERERSSARRRGASHRPADRGVAGEQRERIRRRGTPQHELLGTDLEQHCVTRSASRCWRTVNKDTAGSEMALRPRLERHGCLRHNSGSNRLPTHYCFDRADLCRVLGLLADRPGSSAGGSCRLRANRLLMSDQPFGEGGSIPRDSRMPRPSSAAHV